MVWRGVQKATKSAYVIYEWSPSVHKYLILMLGGVKFAEHTVLFLHTYFLLR
jgi:hypothetical protein